MNFKYSLLGTLFTAAVTIIFPRVVLGAPPSLAMADPTVAGAQAPGGLGPITITLPLDYQVLDSPNATRLHYYVRPSLKARQLNVSIDGKPSMVIDGVSGCPCSVKLPHLASGTHKLTIHAVPGDAESSVTFTIIGGLR